MNRESRLFPNDYTSGSCRTKLSVSFSILNWTNVPGQAKIKMQSENPRLRGEILQQNDKHLIILNFSVSCFAETQKRRPCKITISWHKAGYARVGHKLV